MELVLSILGVLFIVWYLIGLSSRMMIMRRYPIGDYAVENGFHAGKKLFLEILRAPESERQAIYDSYTKGEVK